MSKKKWIISALVLGIFLLLELFLVWPKFFFLALVLADLGIFYGFRYLTKTKLDASQRAHFIILPILFISSAIFYSSIVANIILLQIIFFAVALILYLYFRASYRYIAKIEENRRKFIDIFSLMAFLSIWLVAASIYGLQAFLNLSIWWLMVFLLLAIFLVIYEIVWVNEIKEKSGWLFVFVPVLLLFEVGLVLTFLPLSYNVSALTLAVFYYLITGLMKFYFNHSLNSKIVKPYLFFGLIIIFLILLSARWL